MTTLAFLLPQLRLKIGDTDYSAYRYTDDWLLVALGLSIKSLQKFWNYRYLIDDSDNVIRNSNSNDFIFPESDGIIQDSDEYTIVVYSALMVLQGSLENNSWSAVSWRDNEVSMSNLESFRTRDSNIKRLIDELYSLVKPPTKRLAWVLKNSLPGYGSQGYKGIEKEGDF